MSYQLIEDYTSPNQSSRASYGWTGNPDGITWHWWDKPEVAPSFESVINNLCTPASQVSAHFVVSDNRVACIVSPTEAAWHAGSTEGNGRTIGIEVDPRLPGNTLETCAELAADMEHQFGSLNHYGHKDWSSTECPGIVYDKIPWLIQRTNEILGNSAPAPGPSGNMEAAIQWFRDREGQVTYDMDNRNGPGSYDCSSAVYFALQAAGINTVGAVGNTETMFRDLPAWGFREIPSSGTNGAGERVFPFQRGDVVIWGQQGASGGASGHTMIMVSESEMIHCNAGFNSITTNSYDQIWRWNFSPWETVYRYEGGGSTPIQHSTITVTKDWFDMASRQDLSEVVNDVIHANEGFFRQLTHKVLFDEKFDRQGTVNGKEVGGTSSFAEEAMYAAQNFGRLKADVLWAQKQNTELKEQLSDLQKQVADLKGKK